MTKTKVNLIIFLIIAVYCSVFTYKYFATSDSSTNNRVDSTNRPSAASQQIPVVNSWAYYLKNVNVDVIATASVDLVTIDTSDGKQQLTKQQIAKLKTKSDGSKRQVIAYLSVAQAESYRSYWRPEWSKNRPDWLGNEDGIWKGVYPVTDPSNNQWWEIVKTAVINAIETGYDGILIDGVGSYKIENTLQSKKKMIEFVDRVSDFAKKINRQLIVLVQDNEELTSDSMFANAVDGIVKQNLIHTWKSNGQTGPKTPIDPLNKAVEYLTTFKARGKLVLVVEYVSGEQWKSAKQLIDRYGFVGYSAPRELNVIRIQ